MKSYYLYLLLFAAFIGTMCSSSKKTQAETASGKLEIPVQPIAKDTFLLPELPATMTNPDDRARFLSMHYWDRFDFSNETLITRPEITEQAFVDYVNILNYISDEDAKKSLRNTLDKAEANKAMYTHFASLFDKYYYGPNSPFRNEKLYIPVLRQLVKSSLLDNEVKSRYEFQLSMTLKNQVGTKASNFDYTDASGKTSGMYSIQSDYLILMFSNPGCPTCAAAIRSMRLSAGINNALKRNTPDRTMLTIMTLYLENDMDEWRAHLPELPAQWINAYDKGMTITKKRLYDVQATPTIYLLDKDKKVILKDTSVEMLQQFFASVN